MNTQLDIEYVAVREDGFELVPYGSIPGDANCITRGMAFDPKSVSAPVKSVPGKVGEWS